MENDNVWNVYDNGFYTIIASFNTRIEAENFAKVYSLRVGPCQIGR